MTKYLHILRVLIVLVCASALLPQVGCRKKSQREPTIARIGSREITRSELLALYGIDPQAEQSPAIDDNRIKNAVEDWALDQILIQEALRRGLDQDSSFLGQIAEVRKQLLVQLLYDRAAAAVEVSDEEIRLEYEENRDEYVSAKDQIDLTYIVSPTREGARKARTALQNGTDLTEILLNDMALTGEALGWVDQDDLNPKISAAAFALVPGGTSFPIRYGQDQHIVLSCHQRRPAGTTLPVEEVSDQIRGKIYFNKRLQAEKKLRDSLWLAYNPQIYIEPKKEESVGSDSLK